MKIEVKKIKQGRANICFDCKNAVPDKEGHGCPWSRKFEPVPGWTAEPTTIRQGYKYDAVDTYIITECPLFDPDDDRKNSNYVGKGVSVKVRCIETGIVYESCNRAGQALGIDGSGITGALRNGRDYSGGYHWEKVKE